MDVGVVVALIELVEGAALLEVVWARLDELEAGSKRAATVVVVGVTVLVAVAVLVAREDDDVVLAAVVGARVDEIAPVVVDEMAVLGAGAVDALVACNVEDEESMEIVGVWVVAAVILIELVVLSALMIKASDEVDELEALGELAAAAVVLEAISVSAAVVVGDVLVAREVVDDDDGEEVGRTVVVDFMRPTEVDGARMEVVVLIGLVVCSALVVFRVVVGPTEVVNMVLVGCVVDAMMLVTSEVDEDDNTVVVLRAAVVVDDVLVTWEVVDDEDDVGRTAAVDVTRSMKVVGSWVVVVAMIELVVDDVVGTSEVDEEEVVPTEIGDDVVRAAVVDA